VILASLAAIPYKPAPNLLARERTGPNAVAESAWQVVTFPKHSKSPHRGRAVGPSLRYASIDGTNLARKENWRRTASPLNFSAAVCVKFQDAINRSMAVFVAQRQAFKPRLADDVRGSLALRVRNTCAVRSLGLHSSPLRQATIPRGLRWAYCFGKLCTNSSIMRLNFTGSSTNSACPSSSNRSNRTLSPRVAFRKSAFGSSAGS
jgi:hypothetical protein